MTITPSLTTFKVGQPYDFVVTNVGQTEHEMVIEHRGDVDKPMEVDGQESEAADIEPGKTKTLTWTFTEPGAYQLGCHVPGHYEAGMVTPIEVTRLAPRGRQRGLAFGQPPGATPHAEVRQVAYDQLARRPR